MNKFLEDGSKRKLNYADSFSNLVNGQKLRRTLKLLRIL